MILSSLFALTWALTVDLITIGVNMLTIKELQESVPDLIGNIYMEGQVTVVEIPHGRIKIMPKHRKPGK